jgi:hypothetical protein
MNQNVNVNQPVKITSMESINLGKTQITKKIRVSSAAIFYEGNWFGNYYQYETFIFSDDPGFKTRMWIWGSSQGNKLSDKKVEITKTGHRRISKIMLNKYNI